MKIYLTVNDLNTRIHWYKNNLPLGQDLFWDLGYLEKKR